MHVNRRAEGGYSCSRCRSGDCWNKATCLVKDAHAAISGSIIQKLRSLNKEIDRILERSEELLGDQVRRESLRSQFQRERQDHEVALRQLTAAIEEAHGPLASHEARVEQREGALAEVAARLDVLACDDETSRAPTRREVEQQIERLVGQLQTMDRASNADLKTLVKEILAVPYQQFRTTKVVLRARFRIHLATLLPLRTRAALAARYDEPVNSLFESIPVLVDLFEPSTGPKYGAAALKLGEEDRLGLTAIGRELGITKRQANIAVQFGRALRDTGLTDPFLELQEPPLAAARWRTNHSRSNSQLTVAAVTPAVVSDGQPSLNGSSIRGAETVQVTVESSENPRT